MDRLSSSLIALLRKVWVQIGFAIVAGLFFAYNAPETGFWRILRELGIGLIVAAIVTLFWQLREVSEYFTTLARATLIEDAYLGKLSLPSLRKLRTAAASAILDRLVDNRPRYDWKQIENWVDNVLFEKCLPGELPLSGIYREDMYKKIELQFMSLREALLEVGGSIEDISDEELDTEVAKQTTYNRYTVIAPRRNAPGYAEYPVTLYGKSADMPRSFPLDKRVGLRVGKNEADSVEVKVTVTDVARGGIEFRAEQRLPLVGGETAVWTKLVEYNSGPREPFFLDTMSHLTKELTVDLTIVGTRKKLIFDADVIGLAPGETIEPTESGIFLHYPGWLLEDQGYMIWWWQQD